LAASQGAAGCLFYNTDEYAGYIYRSTHLFFIESNIIGGTNIPSGWINYADALSIIEQTTVNPSAIYTFTNLPPSSKQVHVAKLFV
jgi:hypothetical protein